MSARPATLDELDDDYAAALPRRRVYDRKPVPARDLLDALKADAANFPPRFPGPADLALIGAGIVLALTFCLGS